MIPEGRDMGERWRAALTALALGVTCLSIYAIFSSGFGRLARPARPTPQPAPAPAAAPEPSTAAEPPAAADSPGAAGAQAATGPRAAASGPPLAVITAGLWLTYLPPGLERTSGGAVAPGPGIEDGGWARYGRPDRTGDFAEARVERGTVAATWDAYRRHLAVRDTRPTTLRGRPALAGRPATGGGRIIAWLERPGTGAWIRVSDSLAKELAVIAASAKTPVGD